jgi:hypothetical protein
VFSDHIEVVRDLQNGPALVLLELVEELVKLRFAQSIETGGGFVEDE